MKITIWGINYAPEPTGIGPYNADLCDYLHGRGHTVRMVTGFPYYPEWRKGARDRWRLFHSEKRAGVEVHRCWHYVPRAPSAWRRMVHEATFISSSFLRLFFTPRPDLLLVISPPLLLGPAAWAMGLIKRCPFHFHIQDMQPDAAICLGLLKPGPLTRFLYSIERFTCRQASRVSGITQGMLTLLSAKGVPPSRQYLFPNWIISRPPKEEARPPAAGSFREATGIPPDHFLVVYSGNLGKKQGLDIILDAAKTLTTARSPGKICLVIAGEGAAKDELRKRIAAENLPVHLLPLQPEPMFQAMLRDADLCLVTQQAGSGSLFFPSKVITLLSAGCPLLTVADKESELATAVQEGKFGRNVLPGDQAGLVAAITHFATHPRDREPLAAAGRNWVHQFSRETVLGAFAHHVESSHHQPSKEPLASLAHEQE